MGIEPRLNCDLITLIFTAFAKPYEIEVYKNKMIIRKKVLKTIKMKPLVTIRKHITHKISEFFGEIYNNFPSLSLHSQYLHRYSNVNKILFKTFLILFYTCVYVYVCY
jgi:hypothetical protein